MLGICCLPIRACCADNAKVKREARQLFFAVLYSYLTAFLIFDHKCKWISLHLLLAGMHVAQPCRYCFYSVVQKWVFRPQGRHVAPIDVKFHVYRGKNVGIQPPKLAKFRILARNLYLRGDSFAIFLWNFEHLYASTGSLATYRRVLQMLRIS